MDEVIKRLGIRYSDLQRDINRRDTLAKIYGLAVDIGPSDLSHRLLNLVNTKSWEVSDAERRELSRLRRVVIQCEYASSIMGGVSDIELLIQDTKDGLAELEARIHWIKRLQSAADICTSLGCKDTMVRINGKLSELKLTPSELGPLRRGRHDLTCLRTLAREMNNA